MTVDRRRDARADEQRATLAAVADQLIPAAARHAVGGRVVGDERLRFVLNARPDLTEPLRAALRPELGRRRRRPGSTRWPRRARERSARSSSSIVAGYYTDSDVRELIGYPGQVALDAPLVGVPRLPRGRPDRRRARPRPGLARPGDRAARDRPERTPDLRGALRRGRARPKEDPMATTAPEHDESAAAGWLDPFLADWRPGTGEPREIREPATRPAAR